MAPLELNLQAELPLTFVVWLPLLFCATCMSCWPLDRSLLMGAVVVVEGLPCTPLLMGPELLWLLLATPPRPRLSRLSLELPVLLALVPEEALVTGDATLLA